MARKERTSAELLIASDHLYYEYWMLISMANALASGIASQGQLTNALLGSFVIHFRALLDFFYPGNNLKPDDVIASDFFSQPPWQTIRPELSDFLTKAKIRAHKEVAHLTYSRQQVTPETKPWDFLKITNEINILITLFLEKAPSNLIGLKWQKNRS